MIPCKGVKQVPKGAGQVTVCGSWDEAGAEVGGWVGGCHQNAQVQQMQVDVSDQEAQGRGSAPCSAGVIGLQDSVRRGIWGSCRGRIQLCVY